MLTLNLSLHLRLLSAACSQKTGSTLDSCRTSAFALLPWTRLTPTRKLPPFTACLPFLRFFLLFLHLWIDSTKRHAHGTQPPLHCAIPLVQSPLTPPPHILLLILLLQLCRPTLSMVNLLAFLSIRLQFRLHALRSLLFRLVPLTCSLAPVLIPLFLALRVPLHLSPNRHSI